MPSSKGDPPTRDRKKRKDKQAMEKENGGVKIRGKGKKNINKGKCQTCKGMRQFLSLFRGR